MSELLPCPFCGGNGYIQKAGSIMDHPMAVNPQVWAVYCETCGASTGWGSVNEEGSVELWNRRADACKEEK